MAGMFYSLEEVIEQLSTTEDAITQLVKDGKLKEFRDGDKVLFKVDQVQGLASESDDVVELTADEEELISLEDDGEELVSLSDDDVAPLAVEEDEEVSLSVEEDELVSLAPEGDEDLDLEELSLDISSEGSSIELLLDETMENAGDLDVLSDESAIATPDVSGIGEDVDLAELSTADTNVGTTGINVLADTDDEYALTNDTKSETVGFDSDSTGLGSLDDDINMDSIGSGSGLLDLSLQADDTSLGAVLDDILPAAGEGEAPLTPEESHMADEADKIFEEAGDSSVLPQTPDSGPVVQYFEPKADNASNICGLTLIFPFLALVYMVIVVLMGTKGISPAIVSFAAGDGPMGIAVIWLIVIPLAVILSLTVLITSFAGGKGKKQDVYQQSE